MQQSFEVCSESSQTLEMEVCIKTIHGIRPMVSLKKSPTQKTDQTSTHAPDYVVIV